MKIPHTAFAARLAEICQSKGLKPHGRQAGLARVLTSLDRPITQPAIKKWFDGEALPDMDKFILLATWGGVHLEWLMTGRGPKQINTVYSSDEIYYVAEKMKSMDIEQQRLVARLVDATDQQKAAMSPTRTTGVQAGFTSQPLAAPDQLREIKALRERERRERDRRERNEAVEIDRRKADRRK